MTANRSKALNVGQRRVVLVDAGLHAKVFGRVQGVFFRAHTEEEARKLLLTGWVRNLPDGCVEVMAEGKREALEKLLKWLQHGSTSARVETVEHEWKDFSGGFSGFKIMYW